MNIYNNISDIDISKSNLAEQLEARIYLISQKNQQVIRNIPSNQSTNILIINIDSEIELTINQSSSSKSNIQIINIYRSNKVKTICNNNLNAGADSNIYILSLLTEWSDIVADGNICILPGAANASGHLLEENLILSSKIKIYAKPVLDVQNSQVSASHWARISKIDNKSLFYMMSRGLSEKQATNIILDGYINKILDKLELSDEDKEELKNIIMD